MKFSEFKNRIQEGEEFNIYLFEGEDAYFGESGLRLLREKFVADPTFDFMNLGQAQSDLGSLKDSLSLYPMLSEKRLTCIKEFYPKSEQMKGEIKSFFESPDANSLLVIINSKEHELLKKYQSVCVVECKKADRVTLARWIKGYLQEQGVAVELETAMTFADYCSLDMTRIKLECDKLACYSGVGGKIEKSDLDLMVWAETEYKIYDMTDYIAKGKFDKAVTVINEMLSKGDPHQKILIAIYNYFRRLLHVALSDKGITQTASLLGVKEFAVKKAIEQAKSFTPKGLKNAVDMLTNADYAIKSGTMSADEQMWLAVFSIMTK